MRFRSTCLVALASAILADGVGAAPGPVALLPFASGLAAPVEITHANDYSRRLFVVEQAGRIRILRAGALDPTPFLDIRAVNGGPVRTGGEQGLLGLAFHPSYAASGRFFVFYTRSLAGNAGNELVVARYSRLAGDAERADPSSGAVVIAIPHPDNTNHNGGRIAFGPDGYLYVAVGDGGGGGDPANAGQSLSDLRGKILRLDVDSAEPYAIPPGNPFAASTDAAIRKEIWAYGLRNPWRFSFDRATGDLFIGDVGQGAREEIDHEPAGSVGGRNYGWRVFEGTLCYNAPPGCSLPGHVPPILEYAHDSNGGFSVTGGYRYRGRRVAELSGHYVYGDFVSGRTWAAAPGAGGAWTATPIATLASVSTFGEDEDGELYAANLSAGTIARFAPVDADGDGLSDAWELAHFGSATGAQAAADDEAGAGDGLTNLLEYEEGRDPLAKDNDVFGDARLFAMQQYRDFLGREGDGGGLAGWTGAVGSGAWSRPQVIDALLQSPEFAGFVAPVVRLYFATFLRVPDYAGLVFNAGLVRAGTITPLQLAESFTASPEFAATYGALDNTAFVTLLYGNVLGRAPDPAGLSGWVGLLNGGMSRGQVLLGFSDSAEYQAAMANEVLVTMMYTAMLRRTPEPAGFNGWVGFLDALTHSREQVINGFFLSAEYRARFLP